MNPGGGTIVHLFLKIIKGNGFADMVHESPCLPPKEDSIENVGEDEK